MNGSPPPVRVLVVEDHEAVRFGVRAAFAREPDVVVIGETADAAEALELAAGADVVLLDLALGDSGRGLAGIDVVSRLRDRHPRVRVLVYSQQEPRFALAAIEAGAVGFVPKGAPLGELAAAVRAVLLAPVLPPEVAALVVERVQQPARTRALALGLTERQVEVLVRVAQGWQNLEIAHDLGIDVRTVNRHLENVRERLQIRARGELARWARDRGLT